MYHSGTFAFFLWAYIEQFTIDIHLLPSRVTDQTLKCANISCVEHLHVCKQGWLREWLVAGKQ